MRSQITIYVEGSDDEVPGFVQDALDMAPTYNLTVTSWEVDRA